MDQANPYQAPEPVLPTATEVRAAVPNFHDAAEDLTYGLKLLQVAIVFYCITTAYNGMWYFANFYRYLIDDPLTGHAEFFSYWSSSLSHALGECFFLSGLYFCSTHKLHGVSRVPLLIALVLGVVIFPDQLFQYALDRQWLYFEGYGNVQASYACVYLSLLSWLALDCWLILWTAAHDDTRNHQRVMRIIFLDVSSLILTILSHTVYMLLILDQPLDNTNHAIFYSLSSLSAVLMLMSSVMLFKGCSSLIVSRDATQASQKPSLPMSST